MTDVPTPGPNRDLPPLNPMKARSTLAAILAFLALIAPLIGGGVGAVVTEAVQNGDQILDYADQGVAAINVLIGLVGLGWYIAERRAPNFRLSFKER